MGKTMMSLEISLFISNIRKKLLRVLLVLSVSWIHRTHVIIARDKCNNLIDLIQSESVVLKSSLGYRPADQQYRP